MSDSKSLAVAPLRQRLLNRTGEKNPALLYLVFIVCHTW